MQIGAQEPKTHFFTTQMPAKGPLDRWEFGCRSMAQLLVVGFQVSKASQRGFDLSFETAKEPFGGKSVFWVKLAEMRNFWGVTAASCK